MDQAFMDRVAWAVTMASRCVPQATCLTQAIAAQLLLAWRGYPTHLRIGVAKGEGERFRAHAWVESHGRVIIGGSESLLRYTPLPSLKGESP